jgi:hypothetical protein
MVKPGFPMGARAARCLRRDHQMKHLIFFKLLSHLADIIARGAAINRNTATKTQKPANRPDK